jgi:hypothetical protein
VGHRRVTEAGALMSQKMGRVGLCAPPPASFDIVPGWDRFGNVFVLNISQPRVRPLSGRFLESCGV